MNLSRAFGVERLSDIVIKADADMRPTVKNWNLGVGIRGRAYELADAVAWSTKKASRYRTAPSGTRVGT